MRILTIIFTVFSLFTIHSAYAGDVTAMNITADYYPGNRYAVGFNLDDNHLITQVYFQDETGNKTFFTLDQLSKFQPIFEIAGIKVVQMRIASHTGDDQATIELQYTTNSLSKSTQTLTFLVDYNESEGAYDITDERTHQIIHNAEATTHYSFLHIPVGIANITTN